MRTGVEATRDQSISVPFKKHAESNCARNATFRYLAQFRTPRHRKLSGRRPGHYANSAKGTGKNWLQPGLREFGILGDFEEASHDELDAISSALVGTFHMAGLSEALGTEKEPPLIIPSVDLTRDTIAVGLSGPISAGKTTIARELERRGFHYARFGLTLDELLLERGETLSRSSRQRLGIEIYKSGNQRWLCQRTVSKSMRSKLIVVDGLRFPDDFAFHSEQFGANFRHVFVSADESIRRCRFEKKDNNLNFAEASGAAVERSSESLGKLAHEVFENDCCIDELGGYSNILAKLFTGERQCRHPS